MDDVGGAHRRLLRDLDRKPPLLVRGRCGGGQEPAKSGDAQKRPGLTGDKVGAVERWLALGRGATVSAGRGSERCGWGRGPARKEFPPVEQRELNWHKQVNQTLNLITTSPPTSLSMPRRPTANIDSKKHSKSARRCNIDQPLTNSTSRAIVRSRPWARGSFLFPGPPGV